MRLKLPAPPTMCGLFKFLLQGPGQDWPCLSYGNKRSLRDFPKSLIP